MEPLYPIEILRSWAAFPKAEAGDVEDATEEQIRSGLFLPDEVGGPLCYPLEDLPFDIDADLIENVRTTKQVLLERWAAFPGVKPLTIVDATDEQLLSAESLKDATGTALCRSLTDTETHYDRVDVPEEAAEPEVEPDEEPPVSEDDFEAEPEPAGDFSFLTSDVPEVEPAPPDPDIDAGREYTLDELTGDDEAATEARRAVREEIRSLTGEHPGGRSQPETLLAALEAARDGATDSQGG